MALLMIQFSYTTEAWQALTKNPEDRSKVLGALLDRVGGRLISLYYCMGEYDGIAIIEAPDDEAASAAVIAAINPGHLKTTKMTRLFSVDETLGILRKAGDLTYKGPAG